MSNQLFFFLMFGILLFLFSSIVFLGYGDGSVEAFDIRMKKVYVLHPRSDQY